MEVAHDVQAAVEDLRGDAPPGVRMIVARDVSRFIEASARDVALDMLLGSLLAVAITWAFLRNVRSTLITAIAIPASVIATFFFFFYAMGFTLNVVTLMGPSVAIGILIDDALVVLESTQRRSRPGRPGPSRPRSGRSASSWPWSRAPRRCSPSSSRSRSCAE